MKHKRLEPETLEAVADRFKVLAEPARLTVLNALRARPLSVSDLIDETGLNQANLSKHLQLLHATALSAGNGRGRMCIYSLADRSVFELCDIMCGQLKRHVAVRRSRVDALISYGGEEDSHRVPDRPGHRDDWLWRRRVLRLSLRAADDRERRRLRLDGRGSCRSSAIASPTRRHTCPRRTAS